MKKITLLAICIAAFGAVSYAQNGKYKISPFVSPNVSWMTPDQKFIESNGSVPRFGFGLMVDVMFTDNYAIGTGLHVTRMGGELTYLELTNYSDLPVILERQRTYQLQYAEVPLTLKLRTNEIGYITYWGQFGLGLGVNIRAKADDAIDYLYEKKIVDGQVVMPWPDATLSSEVIEDEDIKNDINIFRASLIVGGGIEYNVSGNTSIIAGIVFNNGFTNVLKGEGVRTDNAELVEYNSEKEPVMYDLKAISNFIELKIGVLF
ncbi:MAG: porin family protein [Flavobacteriales bacterium]|nr:porin family protein [Flavobacteriales bacterium]